MRLLPSSGAVPVMTTRFKACADREAVRNRSPSTRNFSAPRLPDRSDIPAWQPEPARDVRIGDAPGTIIHPASTKHRSRAGRPRSHLMIPRRERWHQCDSVQLSRARYRHSSSAAEVHASARARDDASSTPMGLFVPGASPIPTPRRLRMPGWYV